MHPPDLGPIAMTKRKHVQASDVAVSPDGTTIAAVLRLNNVHDRQELFVWDASKKKQHRLPGTAPNEVEGVAFSPDGLTLATTGALDWDSGRVRFWNTRTWSCRNRALGMGPRHIAYAPDGQTVAVAESGHGGSTKIGIVEVGTGRLIRRFGLIDGISQIAFSPDGRTLAVGHNPEVSVWTVGGRLRWRQRAHAGEVALAFSPDGTALASCDDTTAVVWDAASGTTRYFSKGHANSLRALAYSPDGAVLAVASWAAIRLRDAATGNERLILKTDSLKWIGFWPTQDQVSAVSYDLRFSTWNVTELLKSVPPPAKSTPVAASREQRIAASEQAAFLQAIFDIPEDDTARLAYADWLDEQGQPARAEFIRVQVELARLTESNAKRTKPQEKRITKLAARASELFDQHSDEWLAGLAAIRPVIDETVFERGFLARVRMTGVAVTDDHLRHLAGAPEIVELTLDNSRVTDAGLARLKPLRNLRKLNLSGTTVTPAVLRHLTVLPKLVEVYHHGWGYETMPPEVEAFKRKRNRRLDGFQQPDRRAEALRSLHYVGEGVFDGDRLVGVRFSQRPTTDSDLAYLSEFPELEWLNFCETLAITSAGLDHLRGLTTLKQLHLVDMHITTLEPLRHLTGLEELWVWTAPRVEQDSLEFLAELPRLKRLSLFNCQFDDTIMPHVAKVVGLEELNLTENEVTDEGLECLAGLKKLKKLEVDYETDRKALIRRLLRR